MLLQVLRPADAIRHADAAQPVNPGVGVGGEPRVVFARHADQLDRALLDHLVERQDVIAGDAEDVLDPQGAEPVDRGTGRRSRRPERSPLVPSRCHGRRQNCSTSGVSLIGIEGSARPSPHGTLPAGQRSTGVAGQRTRYRRKPRPRVTCVSSSGRGDNRAPLVGVQLPHHLAGRPRADVALHPAGLGIAHVDQARIRPEVIEPSSHGIGLPSLAEPPTPDRAASACHRRRVPTPSASPHTRYDGTAGNVRRLP